ncbi:unnamed protein product [Closterium sp. Naga37s-1]|nr:unnamed protein product [Closterium sp. Naga37s-1]
MSYCRRNRRTRRKLYPPSFPVPSASLHHLSPTSPPPPLPPPSLPSLPSLSSPLLPLFPPLLLPPSPPTSPTAAAMEAIAATWPTATASWVSGELCDTWLGVVCDGDGYVTQLVVFQAWHDSPSPFHSSPLFPIPSNPPFSPQ